MLSILVSPISISAFSLGLVSQPLPINAVMSLRLDVCSPLRRSIHDADPWYHLVFGITFACLWDKMWKSTFYQSKRYDACVKLLVDHEQQRYDNEAEFSMFPSSSASSAVRSCSTYIAEKILSALRREQEAEKEAAYAANWNREEAHH